MAATPRSYGHSVLLFKRSPVLALGPHTPFGFAVMSYPSLTLAFHRPLGFAAATFVFS